MGRSPRLLCSGSGMSRGIGRSRWLCREPGEEGGVDALNLREGRGRGAFLSFDRSKACLTLPVSPCRFSEGRCGFLEPMAGGGGVAVQCGELRTKGGCHTFVFGNCQIECGLVGGGSRGTIVGHTLARGRGPPLHRGGTPAQWRPAAQG